MSLKTTVGEILVNEALPKSLRDYSRTISGHNIKDLLTRLAERYPSAYADAVNRIKKVGDLSAYESAHSVTLKDFKPDPIRNTILKEIEDKAQKESSKYSTQEEKDSAIVNVYDTMRPKLEKAMLESGLKKGYGLHEMITAKSRGNPNQLNLIVGAKTIIRDAEGKPIMTPIKHSFSEGLDSHEYWADTYGTRKGVLATKIATADSGYVGKTLSTPMIDQMIVSNDCRTTKGLLKAIDDKFIVDRFLAESVGGYSRGDIVNNSMVASLRDKNITKLKVRSPLTCEEPKGICAKCYGLTFKGVLPQIGHHVGLQASQTITEPIAQSALSEKHSGGVSAKKELPVTFNTIESFTAIPKNFPDGARVSEVTGKVTNIEKAPQGGHFVYVEDTKHYVAPDRDLIVKIDDDLDAGDALSDGWRNPSDVVRLKGVGSGRKYFSDIYEKINNVAYGTNSDSRHYEVFGKTLINHAVAEDVDIDSGVLPGDVVDMNYVSSKTDTSNAKTLPVDQSRGKYFAESVLHYVLGDLVDREAIQTLKDAGIPKIKILEDRPPLSPSMLRIKEVAAVNPDWMARLAGEGLKKSLQRAVTKGEKSNLHGHHPIPGLALGTEFGRTGDRGEY